MRKPPEQVKSEYVALRLTRSERRDLETLMKQLRKNKTDAMKHALAFTLQSLPQPQPRPQAAA